jgi:diphthine synthase
LAVGIARVGSKRPIVKADLLKDLMPHEFGCPPHTLIFPGKLHFMEADALIYLADAPSSVRTLVK